MIIIPIVNLDGVFEIESDFNDTRSLVPVRKNMHQSKLKECQLANTNTLTGIGVDLNRNYDFAFAFDNSGSNKNPCEEDYRGPYAFSEPATRQIKNLIELTPEGRNIKIALNFHAWGNLLIHPWSFIKHPFAAKDARLYSNEEFTKILDLIFCTRTIDGAVRFYHNKVDPTCKEITDD